MAAWGSLAPFGVTTPQEDAPNPIGAGAAAITPAIWGALTRMVTLPGKAMQQGITTEEAIPWAADTALGMVGTPGTPAGALGSSIKPIRAYHGSPHDFDKFDLSKIGTGEGAQAYGHGLYFAESEPAARWYRESLSNPLRTVKDTASSYASLPDHEAIAQLLRGEQRAASRGEMRNSRDYRDAAEWIKAGRPEDFSSGRMYEVNINAEPQQFLDWDKPLPMDHPAREVAAATIPNPGMFTFEPEKTLRAIDKEAVLNYPNLTGSQLYGSISRRLDKTGGYKDDAASAALNEAGIPGIKYLDQGSRGAGEGTNNYVVFNDKLIDILRKYGLTGMLGGASAGGAAFGSLAPREVSQ